MPPTYPHPVPDQTLPFQNPVARAADVQHLPDPMKLAARVEEWFKAVAPGVKATSLVDFARPDSVLVVGNADQVKEPDVQEPDVVGKDRVNPFTKEVIPGKVSPGRLIKGKVHGASAQILNGEVPNPHIRGHFDALKQVNGAAQQGLAQALGRDPARLISGDTGLMNYAQAPGAGGTACAQWLYDRKCICINAHVEDGKMLVHEYFHTFDTDGKGAETFGWYMDEGFTDYFARDVSARYRYPYKGNWAYENGYRVVKTIVDRIGLDRVCKLYVERPVDLVQAVQPASQEIAALAKQKANGALNPAAPDIAPLIEKFIAAAQAWNGWPARKWEVNVPQNPFRSRG